MKLIKEDLEVMAQKEVDEFFYGEMQNVLLQTLREIEGELLGCRCKNDRASLLFQRGSVLGLMGKRGRQKKAWRKAFELNPSSDTVRQSLKSLQPSLL